MRPTLTRTLFASFLTLTLLVLVATLGLARWSFERGFYEYVRTLERYRLETIADELVDLYGELGEDWDALDDEAFERIVQRHAPPAPPRPRAARDAASTALAAPFPAAPDARGRAGRRGPRTALFDTGGRQIAGERLDFDNADHIVVPVLFEDERIAELQATVLRRTESPAETAFAHRQTQASVLIGATALVLSAIVSWLLARALLTPVKAAIEGVARLSRGDYGEREAGAAAVRRGDELGRLGGDIERLRQTLDSNRSSRRRLLADVSHELRTPLTILAGEVAAMKDGLRPFDAVQLASIDQEVERLKTLVEDLYELSVSDVGGLRYELAAMDAGDCLERSVESVRRSARDAGIEIEVVRDGPVELQGDRRRLEQLFANLLANAIAYTDAPGRIRIVMASSTEEMHVVFEDTPPGARDVAHEKLFESLYRGDRSRSRRTGGAGLGLAICRNIVDAHGGRIAASPSSLGGLRVDVVLPRRSTGEE